jgi:DNA methylase
MVAELTYEVDANAVIGSLHGKNGGDALVLSRQERQQLSECEAIIKSGLETFYEVGSALLAIRDGRLYRSLHGTFEDYCRQKWQMSSRHANRLIDSAAVAENLRPTGLIPQSESQARELAPLDKELQQAVWQIAVKTAVDEKPTAAHIKSVASVLTEAINAGGLDDGSGEVKPLGTLLDAAITEETYERMMRQKEYIKQSKGEKREAKAREREKLADALKKEYPLITDRYQLIHGEVGAAANRIEAGSVDVIITDPPYPQEYIPLYEDLAKLAAYALKPGGSLLVMIGQSYLPEILSLMTPYMAYHWIVSYLTPGGQSAQLWQRKVNTFWKPVLWLVKGEYQGEWVGDVSKSGVNDNDKRFHEWGQSESGMADLVERFSKPGDLILDPFLGGGTTGVVSLKLNRRFIGVDRDEKAIKTAKQRLYVESS